MTTLNKYNSIKDLVKDYQPDIESALEKLFKEDIAATSNLILGSNNEFPAAKLLDSIKYSVLDGGKRLRPILSLITAEAILDSQDKIDLNKNPALGLALAIELVHCGSLIHDDLPCMDDDDLRRGKPSNHKQFDEATALLAGDFLMTYPIEVLLKYSSKENQLSDAALKFSQAIHGMIVGQALDIEFTNAKVTDSSLLKQMEKLKTGSLLTAAVVIAAILANAKEEQIQALRHYANNLGLAFQITDDILDHTSSPEILGKTCGKDEKQDKLTFVREHGLAKSQEIAASLIDEAKCKIDETGLYSEKLKLIADYVISRTH